MNKKHLVRLLSALCVLPALSAANAQSAYFQAVTNLNPAGYWPMHEVEAAAPGDIETNYGTLGVLGNGYYNDWTALPGATFASIARQVPGPLGAGDTGTYFTNTAPRVTTAGLLLVPHVSPLLTIKPPFTMEGWFNPSVHQIGSFSSMMGVGGGGLNNSANYDGISWNWNNPAGNSGTIWNLYIFDGSGTGTSGGAIGAPSTVLNSNTWYYFAFTYLTNNTTYGYVNGNANGPSGTLNLPMVPSIWSPLTIGNGRWNNSGTVPAFSFDGGVSEVAIYTNVLSSQDLNTHYNDGINSGAGQYFSDVTNDNPIIYFRMNAPAYTPPAVSSWPALANYGTVAGNGVYTPGTVPGLLTAAANGYPVNMSSSVALLSAMGTFADAGINSLLNPTGSNATFTVTAMFRGNPAEARTQSIVGHGTNSWQLGLTTVGKLVFNAGNGGSKAAGATGSAAGDVTTIGVYNDGNWHHVVAVNNTNVVSIYVDGALDTNGTPGGIAATNLIPGNASDVMIAADPAYTNANDNLGRQFAGQVCEVGFFTNAFTPGQVGALYTTLAFVPSIKQQPVSTNVNAASAFTNVVVAAGSSPLAYQWFTNGLAWGGQTNATLILNPVAAGDAFTNMYVVVTNNYGSATSAVVSLGVNTSPVITSQNPVTYTNLATLFAGASPTFSVSASGASPIYYYWFSNNVAIAGATNAVYTITNIQAGLITNLYCVASNFLAPPATSFVWSASVIAAPTAPYPQRALSLNPIGFWRLNEPDDGNGDNNAGVIANDYAGGHNGIYTNIQLGDTGYSGPGSYSAFEPGLTAPDFGTLVFANCGAFNVEGIDFSSPAGTSKAFTVEAWVWGYGQTTDAGIVAKGYGGGGEQFDLDTGSDGGTPSHAYRFLLRDASGATHGVNSSVPPGSTWHHLVGVCDEANSNMTFYIDGLAAGSAAISPGSGILASTWPMSIGARASGTATNYNNQFVGFISDVTIYNYALSSGQVTSEFLQAGVPPFFVQQPQTNISVAAGTTLTVSNAVVSGTPPLTNQWWDATASTPIGAPIIVPTLVSNVPETLVINNVSAALDGHQLYLAVNNLYGSAASSNVTLTVAGPPTLTASNLPPSLTLVSGQSYQYSVTAIGALPLSYQWYNGLTLLGGQQTNTYTLTAGAPGTVYSISVLITNLIGSLASAVSTVTVIPTLTNGYATNVLAISLHGPVGYWPLQETNPPAAANLETNYGSLGVLGTAYYAITNAATSSGNGVAFNQTGLPGGEGDAAAKFYGLNNPTPTSYAFVPRVSPALTLQPPLTLECWVYATSTAFGDLIGEGGSGLDSTAGNGNAGGIRMSYSGGSGGAGLQLYVFDGNGSERPSISTPAGIMALNAWHHCVATYDGTNGSLYVDGVLEDIGPLSMAIDTWTPLTVGAGYYQGYSPIRGYSGVEDEAAVYTNLLTTNQIMAHFAAGSSSSSNYFTTITNDNPLLYYRMDNPAYVGPDSAVDPEAINYGSVAVISVYQQEIVPGGLPGPATNMVAPLMNGVFSCVDAGYAPAFNPTGTQPFTAMTWFKTYPADGRVQALISHGLNWSLDLDGTTGEVVWTNTAGPAVASPTVLNDNQWHFVAGVYDGAHNYLYVDGELAGSAAASGGVASDTADDLYLGGNAAFTQIGTNQTYFAGAISQAAFYTNALTVGEIQHLYTIIVPSNSAPAISLMDRLINYSGTLQYSTNVAGPFMPVPGATSPYMVPVTNSQMFYRTGP